MNIKIGSVCIQVFESKGGSCRCESSQNIYMVDVRSVLDRRNGCLKLSECSKDFTLTAQDSNRNDGRFDAEANWAVLKEKLQNICSMQDLSGLYREYWNNSNNKEVLSFLKKEVDFSSS